MALTPSSMLPLGTPAPDFELPDTVTGRIVRRDDLGAAAGLLVLFMCNHCPYVVHVRAELARLGRHCEELGVAMVGISSNDVAARPEDGPEAMAREAKAQGYVFPYLFDETQEVAKAYQAACTPEAYLFDAQRRLVYRGQLDDSRPGNGIEPSGRDVRAALDALLAGREVDPEQTPSIGCNIKWKPGNAPHYG